MPAGPDRIPTVVVTMENVANTRLLDRVLGSDYALRYDLDDIPDETPDLVIIDWPSLQRELERLRKLRRTNEPVVLPVLLVTESRYGGQSPASSERLSTELLGQSVDDIIRIPTSRAELTSRIQNLLRLRELSRAQEGARRELADVVGALRILNACDQVLVRAKSETGVLQSLCQTIVDAEDYHLAWIGFIDDDGENSRLNIRARAGPAARFADRLPDFWKQGDGTGGTVDRARQSQEPQVVTDIENEPGSSNARDNALAHGLASAIVLPIHTDIGPPGYLAIYSDTPGHFNRDEAKLLERLAANLGYALNTLRFQRERERQSAAIHDMAFSDELTGLPNRRYLVNVLDEFLADEKSDTTSSAAILFVDLDGFKLINDALGHEAGDEVLKQVSHRLTRAVRDSDLVTRQGGDEFVVVMFDQPRTNTPVNARDPEGFASLAKALARRIVDHLSEPLTAGEQKHYLSASIGISLCPEHGRDPSAIIQCADTAMYEAKKLGGGQTFLYTSEVFAHRQKRLSLQGRLRQAIDNDELALHYQPIFDLKNRRMVGTEALVRWPQEDGSLISPGEFIPVAEENGLIKPMGDWVLTTAAEQLTAWHNAGFQIEMSINLSAHQLTRSTAADHIANRVQHHIDPEWMTLEITESAIMEDSERVEDLLRSLHGYGFQIAIDDFGTGYSSLGRLQQMPIQILKIDRSFINQIDLDGDNDGLIPIIQQMARSFELETVAEGIEDEQQYHHLLEAGVPFGQGFWYGRPVPEHEIRKRLADVSSSIAPGQWDGSGRDQKRSDETQSGE